MSNVPDTLANRIKLFRKLRGMTQQDLSEAAGVNLSIIKKYEVGILNPKIERLEVIANALGISLYSLTIEKISFSFLNIYYQLRIAIILELLL